MWEIAVHMAVVCDVYDGVFFFLSFFPRDVLDEILNLIESVSEGFPSYSYGRKGQGHYLTFDPETTIILQIQTFPQKPISLL